MKLQILFVHSFKQKQKKWENRYLINPKIDDLQLVETNRPIGHNAVGIYSMLFNSNVLRMVLKHKLSF